MKNSVFGKFIIPLLMLSAALLSACDTINAYMDDPVYFGDGKDLGKNVGGSGTGHEVKSPHDNFSYF